MKHILICLLLLATSVYATTDDQEERIFKPIKVYGKTTYTQSNTKSLISTINLEYRIKLHEPKHKKWLLFLGGKISCDYDHFGKEMRQNVFTVFGIDF